MQITEEVSLVGSGNAGFCMTDDWDCNVYLIQSGGESALIDAGAGMGTDAILENIRRCGVDPGSLKYILLTHCHSDHAGGAVTLSSVFRGTYLIPEAMSESLRIADEAPIGLDVARADGVYPPDYRIEPFTSDMKYRNVRDGDTFPLGAFHIRSIHLPGHSTDSTCYLFRTKLKTYLFSGDAIFVPGVISLLNCVGSELGPYRANIHKLENLNVDCLLPGHYTFTFNNGQRHIETVRNNFRRLWPPRNLF